MKNLKNTRAATTGWLAVGIIVAVLAVLFWRSFLSDFVFFSNDGPLGVQNAAWGQMPSGMTGIWVDLNYLGSSGGADTPSITAWLHTVLSPIYFAKFYPMATLLILGLGAWTLFRELKLTPLAASLGALAAMLNSTFFSTACWGVSSQEIAAGMIYFAAALIVGCHSTTPLLVRWTRLILAGLCVGMNVMEAADIGALYSMLIALFVFVHALVDGEDAPIKKVFVGVGRVAVVAAFAGFIAFQAVFSLIGVGISGVAGTAQDTESKAAHWDWATQWSLPKAETAGLLVPGLFGYKMDTPQNMQPSLQEAYASGVYWGGMGRDPNIDRYFDSGSQGQQPGGFMRFTGGGNYCGILVFLVAGWAIAQSLRRQNSVFPDSQKRMVLFLGVVTFLCLLLSWGRFAPFFYKIPYDLIPYFSTIRNPAKFLNFFSWALAIIFAYGVHGLNRRYLDVTAMKTTGIGGQVKNWWAKAGSFDRKWTFASGGLLAASVLGWMVYMAQKPALIEYLHKVGFGGTDASQQNSAPAIADFSFGQAGWFLVLFAIGIGLLLLVIAGCFNGPRAKIGAVLLGGFLLFDMGRANLPWLVHWDYKQKYEVGSLNPVVEFLRNKPYENRVAYCLPNPLSTPQQFALFDELYKIEWMQHHFPYYNIQSLDLVQNPRPPEDMMRYEQAFQFLRFTPSGGAEIDPEKFPLAARKWQLTNTRYLLGPAGFLDELNQALDPVQHRFRILQRFDVLPKPGVGIPYGMTQKQIAPYLSPDKLTAYPSDDGDYALFEFSGALPRAKVYSSWQVSTNDDANLKTLADLNFDPAKTVLISTPEPGLPAAATNDESGSVEY
ncbi:MAG TPA: hypothetical protein VH251_02505, partial [Verrucomicrobiae bacterium]|nr:hypothetical protein [Verrucomicrobiae bacterium]